MNSIERDAVPAPKTKFLKVKCSACGNEQIIFSAPASDVKCLVCNQIIAKSGSSKADLKTKIVKELS